MWYPDAAPDVVHHPLQVAPGHVGHDDYLALDVLTTDGIGATVFADLGQRMQRKARTARGRDQGGTDRIQIGLGGRGIADHEVEARFSLDHSGDLLADEGGLYRLGDLAHHEPVAGNRTAIELDSQEGNVRLLFQGNVDGAGNIFGNARYLCPQAPQLGEIRTEDLDGDSGTRT